MAEPFKNTPPAPEAKGEMTAANIAAALAGESQASQKYLAFAESTHARNHLSVLGAIGTTEENLKAAWGGETFEIDEMYAAYMAVAKLQENKSAQTTIRYADAAEKDHQAIYDAVSKGVASKQDCGTDAVRVCPICGHTIIGDAPDECPVCGTAGVYFKEF
jgi:rubrerythrin